VTALDTVAPLHVRVGFGNLGTEGDLGYENKSVSVGGTSYASALSTHPPARLLYHLGGAATHFRCRVALNDDVAHAGSWADFSVAVDGRVVAEASRRAPSRRTSPTATSSSYSSRPRAGSSAMLSGSTLNSTPRRPTRRAARSSILCGASRSNCRPTCPRSIVASRRSRPRVGSTSSTICSAR
jgi:hypothetical protein